MKSFLDSLQQRRSKARRFQIWSICLLVLIILSTLIAFLAQTARRPSEKFVSVSFVRTNVFGTAIPAISIELSNRMSFNLNYWIVPEVDGNRATLLTSVVIYRTYSGNSLTAHSQRRELLLQKRVRPEVHILWQYWGNRRWR